MYKPREMSPERVLYAWKLYVLIERAINVAHMVNGYTKNILVIPTKNSRKYLSKKKKHT